jgi:hypothetical protein
MRVALRCLAAGFPATGARVRVLNVWPLRHGACFWGGVTFFEKAALTVVLMPLALSFVLVLWA